MEKEIVASEQNVSEQNEATKEVATGNGGNNNKKSLKWLWITIALAIFAAIAAWCIYNVTQTENKNSVMGVSIVVALLFGVFLVATLGYLLGSISI